MNSIRATRALNQRELDEAVPPSASWHADYRDTAYIYIGGLALDLSEGDVLAIFSQFGNPTHLNLVREKESGKSRGFAFLKYEDQRSCDLAVDNLGGADVLGRVLRVDHSRYKRREGEDEETWRVERLEAERGGEEGRERKRRKVLKEEVELDESVRVNADDGGEEDPMKEYLVREKRGELEMAQEREREREKRHKHNHRHRHRGRNSVDRDGRREDGDDKSRRHRHRDEEGREQRRRHREEDDEDAAHSRRRKERDEKRYQDDFDDGNHGRRRSRSPERGHRRRRDRSYERNGKSERHSKCEDKHRDESGDKGRERKLNRDRDQRWKEADD